MYLPECWGWHQGARGRANTVGHLRGRGGTLLCPRGQFDTTTAPCRHVSSDMRQLPLVPSSNLISFPSTLDIGPPSFSAILLLSGFCFSQNSHLFRWSGKNLQRKLKQVHILPRHLSFLVYHLFICKNSVSKMFSVSPCGFEVLSYIAENRHLNDIVYVFFSSYRSKTQSSSLNILL